MKNELRSFVRSRLLPLARSALFAGLLVSSAQAAADPVVNAVADRFVPAAPDQKVEGYLGPWITGNIEEHLLLVDVDSLLSAFTHRPGPQEWSGEHIGKWLHAASLSWTQTHDPRLRAKLDYAARTLIATQEPDGYLGTYLPKDRWTSWDVWVHKYVLIGLLSYYHISGDPAALDACRKVGDLLCATFGAGKRDIVTSGEHVGMAPSSVLEPMVKLYCATGETKYLDFCRYIVRDWDEPQGPKIIASLLGSGRVDLTANAKAYEMMSCLVGLAHLYRVTGETRYLAAVTAAWRDIQAHQTYATGTSSWAEHFQKPDALRPEGAEQGNYFVGPGEGCVTVTWIQLSRELLRLTGEPAYAQELERSIYNALLGAECPADGTVTYFSPLLGRKRYGDPAQRQLSGISCCASSVPRGIALIPDLIAGTIDGAPALLLYNAGRYPLGFKSTAGAGETVALEVATDFPATGHVAITVQSPRPAAFPLLLRVPEWSRKFSARVGGERFPGEPGTYLRIARTWSPGDQISVDMDMPIFTVPEGNSPRGLVAVQRGPQVLAADDSITAARLPDHWHGTQLYLVNAEINGAPKTLALVPFAEAGQTKANYEAAFLRLKLE